jgi:hypothetical protein
MRKTKDIRKKTGICGYLAECKPPDLLIRWVYFFAVLRIALTVVPQTAHCPFKAGLPFFMVTFCPFFISVLVLHFTQ